MQNDENLDAADAAVAAFVLHFGKASAPDLIAAVLDWYARNGDGAFARSHVLPEAEKLLDNLIENYAPLHSGGSDRLQ
jgi:hypothetical protein